MDFDFPFGSKKHFYTLLRRKYHILPKYSSPFVTMDYLYGVWRLEHWTPMCDTVVRRDCVDPPSKEFVHGEVASLLRQKGHKPLGDIRSGLPDRPYLLECLATLEPEHRIFARDWVAPPVRRRNRRVQHLEGIEELLAGVPKLGSLGAKRPSRRAYNRLLKIQARQRGEQSAAEDSGEDIEPERVVAQRQEPAQAQEQQ